jgi:hypothetical protein
MSPLGWVITGLGAWAALSVVTAALASAILRRSGVRARDTERDDPKRIE